MSKDERKLLPVSKFSNILGEICSCCTQHQLDQETSKDTTTFDSSKGFPGLSASSTSVSFPVLQVTGEMSQSDKHRVKLGNLTEDIDSSQSVLSRSTGDMEDPVLFADLTNSSNTRATLTDQLEGFYLSRLFRTSLSNLSIDTVSIEPIQSDEKFMSPRDEVLVASNGDGEDSSMTTAFTNKGEYELQNNELNLDVNDEETKFASDESLSDSDCASIQSETEEIPMSPIEVSPVEVSAIVEFRPDSMKRAEDNGEGLPIIDHEESTSISEPKNVPLSQKHTQYGEALADRNTIVPPIAYLKTDIATDSKVEKFKKKKSPIGKILKYLKNSSPFKKS
jgi:hypothetical protein